MPSASIIVYHSCYALQWDILDVNITRRVHLDTVKAFSTSLANFTNISWHGISFEHNFPRPILALAHHKTKSYFTELTISSFIFFPSTLMMRDFCGKRQFSMNTILALHLDLQTTFSRVKCSAYKLLIFQCSVHSQRAQPVSTTHF